MVLPDLLGLPEGDRSRGELSVHDLKGVADHVVRLGQRTERGQNLVVNALSQQNLVKRVLKTIARIGFIIRWERVVAIQVFILAFGSLGCRVVDTGQSVLYLLDS